MGCRGCVLVAIAVGSGLIGGPGLAQPVERSPQVFRAPPECGTEAEFVEAVEVKLGRRVVTAMLAMFSVEIRVEPDGFAAYVEFNDGQRLIRGGDCREVVDAATLVVATAIGAAERERIEPPPKPIAARRIATGPSPWDGGVEGHLTGDMGTVSNGGLAAGGAVWLALHGWRAEVGAAVFQPRDNRLAPAFDVGVELRLWTATAAACRGIWRLAACVGGETGVMRAHGFGFDIPEQAELTWWAWTTSLRVPLRLSRRVAGLAALQAVLPHSPPRFVTGDGTEVFVPSDVILRLHLGVEAKFF